VVGPFYDLNANDTMTSGNIIHVRIDKTIQEQAGQALAEMGLSISDAVRMLLMRIAREKAIPFEVRVPNAETIEAMEAARRGDVASFNNVEELMADLNAED
jgi:DNA-damage-inducible protein J